ncbi:MmcQ/YjbR family DNA-binding protein [Herbiconiux sp. CPCC 205763]|uniref:MmcQ/YjbR family DNA-binding protein n=1 Tax=Herbiconiux aconitum TaxID=2970913 RepID=A0ABT2GJW3_9MICO|nr:MmcQ/YjbR family DNA-binding protein [Herbiconiux aconitum]MCS5716516.1 MmcQ/YjbR family DNA-binding protein [Herbiconiux aconitum]
MAVVDGAALALELPGAIEVPHHDRRAFKVSRIFASLPRDALTMNVGLAAEEQAMFCRNSAAFTPVNGAWGQQGWTVIDLGVASDDEVAAALELAHARA